MKNRRTLAEARAELVNSRVGTCSVEEAEEQIIAELADGRRRAEGVQAGGIEYEPISEAVWLQVKEPLFSGGPPWQRQRLVSLNFDAGILDARGGQYLHIREVLYLPQDVPPAPVDCAPPPAQRPKNPGGAPTRYDWDRVWTEIVRIANSPDGLPGRPTLMRHLYDKMTEWNWEELPSESAIKTKLSRLYNELDLHE